MTHKVQLSQARNIETNNCKFLKNEAVAIGIIPSPIPSSPSRSPSLILIHWLFTCKLHVSVFMWTRIYQQQQKEKEKERRKKRKKNKKNGKKCNR